MVLEFPLFYRPSVGHFIHYLYTIDPTVDRFRARRLQVASELNFARPGSIRIAMSRFFPITPNDICPPQNLELFREYYPDLFGDKGAVSWGDDGNCPSWVGDTNWWMQFFPRK